MTVQEWLGQDNQLGIDIWQKKYQHNGESFDEWLDRVSGGNEDIRELIKEKKFLFGGRILANRGLDKLGRKITLSNCYVMAPPEDNIESIFDCATKLARTYSYGGGCGLDISKLSPRGAKINNAAKRTTGSISFTDLFNLVTALIGAEGRRGALMISISCNHPDLEEFIELKSDLNKTTNANISIRITDEFMRAVKEKRMHKLSFIREETGEVIEKEVNAYDIFKRVCEMNWDFAEPGMLFWDHIDSWNMVSEDDNFQYAGVNPCFTGDMELLTADGYKTFEELCGSEIDIYNVDGNIVRSKVWCSGQKETIKLKTSHGYITCTPDHVFMTMDGEECKAKDLIGQFILPITYTNNPHLDKRYIKYGFIQGDGQLNKLDEYTGDGVTVNVGKKDTDIRNLFSDENFTTPDHRRIHVYNFKDDLLRLGFSTKRLPERVFPTTYKQWTKLQKASFLQGCYSANGSVIKKGRISYKTTCKEFADQLLETLQNDFGIRDAYITVNKPKHVTFANGTYLCKMSFDVNIGQFKEVTKFMAEINFYQQYKREQLSQMIRKRSSYVYSIVPNGIQNVYDFTEPERHWGVVEGCIVHNCAEEPLLANSSCLLGSINLAEFVKEDKLFDYGNFKDAVRKCIIALNEVLDEGMPLHPLQEQRDSVRDWRAIGLGIFGLSDCLIKMGIRYGSRESIDICDLIGFEMANTAIRTSMELAEKYGPYPMYDAQSILKSKYLVENTKNDTYELVAENGLRNSQLLTIAPTGSLSTMLGVSGGIEPIYANSYQRKTQSLHGHDEYYTVYTPIVKQYMEEHDISDEKDLPDFFVTAKDLKYKERIDMQAVWQIHIDASISSTVNVPNEFTVEDTMDLYSYAWLQGLKGVTIFRDGCARVGVLSENKEDESKDKIDICEVSGSELKRGEVIKANDECIGKKRTLHTGCGTLHCEAFFDRDTGDLREAYLSKGSSGGCNNFMIGLSRMISLSARGGLDIFKIVDQLKSSGTCPSYAVRTATKHDTSKGSSCPVAVGNALIDMYEEMQKELGKEINPKENSGVTDHVTTTGTDVKPKCPECGSELIFEGGCNTCKNCGYSKCD